MAHSRATRRIRWALVLVGLSAVLLLAYTGHQALAARDSLQQVATDVERLQGHLVAGDAPAARSTLRRMQHHASDAETSTRGPGWWLLTRTPAIGPNVHAVRTVAEVSHEIAGHVLPDVVRASTVLEPERLRPTDGRVDLAPVERVAPAVVEADRRLSRQARRVQAISTAQLTPQVASPVRRLQAELADAAAISSRTALVVRLLPRMLGADGRRTYLLMFQNNAELRSTGGIPGAFAVVHADQGRVRLGAQGNSSSMGPFRRPVLPLTRTERELFGTALGSFSQDVTATPHFPRSAQLISAMWRRVRGVTPDGVLSVDPVALSYLLRGTGPVQIGQGRSLDADSAVSTLLNQVYLDLPDPEDQDAYFARVARRTFEAVASGQGRPEQVLDGLVTSATQRRVLLWSAHPEEQRLIEPTRMGGALPVRAGRAPQVGVYLNDGSQSKLDYYLDHDVAVRSVGCRAGRQELEVRVRLASRVPRDTRALGDYVLGSKAGLAPATIRTMLYVYAPVGGSFSDSTLDGERLVLTTRRHLGRPLVAETIGLAPGQRATATFRMTAGPGQTDQAQVQVTPGVRGTATGRVSASTC